MSPYNRVYEIKKNLSPIDEKVMFEFNIENDENGMVDFGVEEDLYKDNERVDGLTTSFDIVE